MRISVEYDFKLDGRGYCNMYASTHTPFEGEDTLYAFSEAGKEAIGRRVGYSLHLGGFSVERATLKKIKPGCDRMHMDCSLEVAMLLDGSVVGHIVRGDEIASLRRFAEDVAYLLAFSLREEVEAAVEEWRFSRLSYRYI